MLVGAGRAGAGCVGKPGLELGAGRRAGAGVVGLGATGLGGSVRLIGVLSSGIVHSPFEPRKTKTSACVRTAEAGSAKAFAEKIKKLEDTQSERGRSGEHTKSYGEHTHVDASRSSSSSPVPADASVAATDPRPSIHCGAVGECLHCDLIDCPAKEFSRGGRVAANSDKQTISSVWIGVVNINACVS